MIVHMQLFQSELLAGKNLQTWHKRETVVLKKHIDIFKNKEDKI